MDEAWEREANGPEPSFQEFLAAGHEECNRFLAAYIASRGLAPDAIDREYLLSFLHRSAGAWLDTPTEAERLLDAFIRVRPERAIRSRQRGGHEHTA
ncbi:MAG TPA: hypothetical protein VFB54_03140 [Burkholderiales bacterium]|nr:hypothetical protein [Burkholderiales bacterium]